MINVTATTAIAAVNLYMANDIPAFIWGSPGIGKTQMIHALGKSAGLPVMDYRLLFRDATDLRGLPTITADGATAWARPSDLPFIGNDGADAGILFLDELNVAAPSLQAAGFGLVEERRVADHVLKPGWRIIAAGNHASDKAAAQRMPSALANRFAHLFMNADLDAWCAWANRSGIAPVLVAFLRLRPNMLHDMTATAGQQLTAFPTPRAWEKVSRLINAGLPDALFMPMVAGIVGDGAAAELWGFVRVWRGLPTIADIIANPDKITIPGDPSTAYAVSTALARKADRSNFAPILRFANRALGTAHTTVLVTDAIRRDETLKETSAFIAWAAANDAVTF